MRVVLAGDFHRPEHEGHRGQHIDDRHQHESRGRLDERDRARSFRRFRASPPSRARCGRWLRWTRRSEASRTSAVRWRRVAALGGSLQAVGGLEQPLTQLGAIGPSLDAAAALSRPMTQVAAMRSSLDAVAALQPSLIQVASLDRQLASVADLKSAMTTLRALKEPMERVAALQEPMTRVAALGSILENPGRLIVFGLLALIFWGGVTFGAVQAGDHQRRPRRPRQRITRLCVESRLRSLWHRRSQRLMPSAAAAQNVGIRLLHDGDCKVTVDWPANTDVSGFRLLINGQPATRVVLEKNAPFTIEPGRARARARQRHGHRGRRSIRRRGRTGCRLVSSRSSPAGRPRPKTTNDRSSKRQDFWAACSTTSRRMCPAVTRIRSRPPRRRRSSRGGQPASPRSTGCSGSQATRTSSGSSATRCTACGPATSIAVCRAPPPVCNKTATTSEKFLLRRRARVDARSPHRCALRVCDAAEGFRAADQSVRRRALWLPRSQ